MSWSSRNSKQGVLKDDLHIADLILPDHLLLRAASRVDAEGKRALSNWPAYHFGVEMLLRTKGLAGHLNEEARPPPGMSVDQWQAEDDLCKFIIGCNVKDFTDIFGSSLVSNQDTTAANLWVQLAGRFLGGELECKHM